MRRADPTRLYYALSFLQAMSVGWVVFDLYLVREDGTGLERITYTPAFDGFPMFSPDGTRLVWASNRNNRIPGETNIFVADWVE